MLSEATVGNSEKHGRCFIPLETCWGFGKSSLTIDDAVML